MAERPSYEELEARIRELEKDSRVMQDAYRESEERYQTLFQRSFDIIYIHDFEGRFIDGSDITVRALGYSKEEIRGMRLQDILSEDQLADAYGRIQELKETGSQKSSSEYLVKCKDGSWIWLETKASVIYRQGRPYAVQGIARDITERKLVEEALGKSEEKYRRILKNMEEAYFEIDLKGRFTFFNDAACTMTGYSPEELIGLSYHVYSPPETARRLFNVFNRIYTTGKTETLVDYEIIRKDGAVRTHELSAGLLRDESGAPVGFHTLARDITTRKEAEEKLRRREERYRNILESMEEAYYEVDLKGNFTFVNTTPVQRLGYAHDELMGLNFREYMDKENAGKVFDAYHRVFVTGQPLTLDWELTDKKGQKYFVEASVSLKRDENGNPSGFKGVVRDISQRKKAEEALRVSEEKYRTILQNMEESYIEVDLRGNITFFNDATVKNSGYSREELMGMNNRAYMRPEVAAEMYGVFKRVYESGKPAGVLDYEIFRKDGTTRNVEMTVSLLHDASGRPSGFRCLARDVTGRILAEHALKQSERMYRMLAENAHDAIWAMNTDLEYTFASPSMDRLTGYTFEEIRRVPLKDQLRPESYALAMSVLEEELAREGREYVDPGRSRAMELEYIRRDGSSFWVDLTVTFTRDMNGKITGVMGVGRDITERVKAREELREINKRLSTLVQAIPDVIYFKDAEGRNLEVNRAFELLTGRDKDQLIGKTDDDFLPPELAEQCRRSDEEAGRLGKPLRFDETVRLPDGREISFETIKAPIFNDRGGYAGLVGVSRDITDRVKAREELAKSEKRHRLLAENARDVIWVIDLNLKHVYVSPSVRHLRGYTYQEAMQQDIRQILTPDSYRRVLETFAEELLMEERGQVHGPDWSRSIELEMYHKEGGTVWTEVTISILYDDEGKTSGLLGISRDITQRKKVEEALRQTHERYRTIFENTGNATILIGEDTTILLANSNFEKLTGYSKEEMEGRMSWTVFIAPEDLEMMKKYHQQRRDDPASAPTAYEFRLKSRSGESRDIFLTVALISGSKESVASCMDITERKKAEESLRISQERFRDLAELLPESVFETDIDGNFIFVNRFAYERFMFTVDDFTRGINIMDVIVPEDHARAEGSIKDILSGQKIGLSEYMARKKDGSTFSAMVHSTAILREGRAVGIRGFLIDISEKKILEEQLTRAQKMEAIGTLAGGIAHDFNNLLMGILGNVSLLMMKADDSHPFLDRLKNIEEYVQRGSDLTKQLLGFARGGKYEVKSTDLGEFVRRSSEMFGRTKKEVRIHRKTAEGLWPVELDRGQMEQVLLNLYVNAWQAMPTGGDLYLSVENVVLDAAEISPYELKPGRYVKVTVTDTGLGMDEAVKSRVFEPFFTTKERGRGTGLGLASVYGIVKNHGGFVHLESEKGMGSTFIICLPASSKMPDIEKKTTDELQKGKGTILLIDDEDMILDVGSQMLSGLGYAVLTARGGRDGIDVYRERFREIDLVILDLIMPDVGGDLTFGRLHEINPSVKVLLSSGYSLDGQAKEIMDKGCRGFIQKPFTLETLSRRVSGILEEQPGHGLRCGISSQGC